MARTIREEPGLQSFVNRIDQYPQLDREAELELARRLRAGDRQAGEELIESHLRSVVKMALKYRGYGIYLSDLIAEGNVGLLEAARRFEPERGLRFLTYARHWVRAYMLAHILKHWSIVDLGTTARQSKLFFRLQGEHARLTSEMGGDGDAINEELASEFGTSVETVRESLSRLGRRDASLDVPVLPDSRATFADLLVDEQASQETRVARAETVDLVHGAVAGVWPQLDCRERMILRGRLLPEADREPETLAALGRRMGVTRERVRQIEAAVKGKLRRVYEQLVHGEALEAGAPAEVCGNCPSELCAA